MNNAIYVDAPITDQERREKLYDGQLFIQTPRPASLAFTNFAKSMIEEGFGRYGDPQKAQFAMPVEEFVRVFAPMKPAFIHHPETKRLIQAMLADWSCDMDDIYLDVPRLRAVTSDAYLTAGVGFAHHPHRDTWYSAPMCQINWWLPIYPIESEASMAFHPKYWSEPVLNGSEDFNYYEWNAKSRSSAAQHIKTDTRPQPKPLEPVELDPQHRLITQPGGAILFSAAQLHSTVPNTWGKTRFSIDFRTVSLRDLREGKAAPNIDSRPTGTSLRDFMRGSDLTQLPQDVIAKYDSGAPVDGGVLVFKPEEALSIH